MIASLRSLRGLRSTRFRQLASLFLFVLLAAPGGLRLSAGPLSTRPQAPEFEGQLKWLNSPPLELGSLKGKVVLIDFWEYTCVNCLRTLPYLKEWDRRYRDKGLVIVGVHAPEFQFAKKDENVAAAVKQFDLPYPIVLDSEHAVWKAWGNRFWPAKYLVGPDGTVRYYHFGEGSYGETEAEIQRLLREIDPKVKLPEPMEPLRAEDGPKRVCYPVTPELYLGYERGGYEGTLGNREGYRPEKVQHFRDPDIHEDGRVYAHGDWQNAKEALVSARRSRYPRDWIALLYHALEVNAVIRPENGTPVRFWVYQDGKPVASGDRGADLQVDERGRTFVVVDRPRMYHLIKNHQFGQHELRLATSQPGGGIYAFTFVSCAIADTP